MTAQPIAVLRTGLVTSVGLTAASTCAAIRCKITNPIETNFIDSAGQAIMGHSVPLDEPWRGRAKLAKMTALAIRQCIDETDGPDMPLLLCVAERERPGRVAALDEKLFEEIQHELRVSFSANSRVIPHGRIAVGVALREARRLIEECGEPRVLIAAADSLLTWPTLRAYEVQDRLLTERNSNGFMPGEGAGAVLVSADDSAGQRLLVCGLGHAIESAAVYAELPLRGEGLTLAIRNALAEAGCELHELDFRITDLSGEQYYFKEASLALTRILRARRERFDIWHPAECIGEAGAVGGLATLVVAEAACRKHYAPGSGILCHASGDNGARMAIVLRYRDT